MTLHSLWERVLDAFTETRLGAAGPLLAVVVLLAATGTAVAAGLSSSSTPDAFVGAAIISTTDPDDADPMATAEERQPAAPEAAADPEAGEPATLTPEAQPEAIADAEPDDSRIPLVPAEPRLAAFAGLSTWIDLYDIELSPEEQVAVSVREGVEAIYVQSARMNSPVDIHDAERLARLIDAAKDHDLKVMVWYIPDFVDLDRDYRRSIEAIRFTTPRGNRADAFGLDIELEDVADIAQRNHRLLTLSAAIRDWAGPDYPLAAVVLPPLQLDLRPSWWPAFPWAELRPHYDVFVPMSYSSYRGTSPEVTYQWNLDNVLQMRHLTGDPDLPVHLAGGIADNLPHVDAFVRAAAEADVLGAGLYDLDTTPDSAWPDLRALRSAPWPSE